MNIQNFDQLPDGAFVPAKVVDCIIPLSRVTRWRKIKAGSFPKPVALGEAGRCPAWRVGDLRQWLDEKCAQSPALPKKVAQ